MEFMDSDILELENIHLKNIKLLVALVTEGTYSGS